MNEIYRLFNPELMNNQQHYNVTQQQMNSYQQYQEIANGITALHDFFDAARKIDPRFREIAFNAFLMQILAEINKQ